MTVLQNVQLALVVAAGGASDVRGLLVGHADGRCDRYWQVGLQSTAADAAASLAYGDVKRLELALALAAKPRLLLMDEPTAGMAPSERSALMQAIVSSRAQATWPCCSPSTAWTSFSVLRARVLVLSRGRLIADGVPEAVRADAEVQAVYLGRRRERRARAAGSVGLVRRCPDHHAMRA